MIPDVTSDPEANRGFICFLLGFGCGAVAAAMVAVPGLAFLWWAVR